MFLTFLFVTFSQQLTFKHLTLPILWQWYCNHPFLFLAVCGEMISYVGLFISLFFVDLGLKEILSKAFDLNDEELPDPYHEY